MDFAQQLKRAMEERGITQTQLSSMTGIGKPSISLYLSGKCIPRPLAQKKIEEALKCIFLNVQDKKDEPASDGIIKFSSKKITVRQAARIMHMSENTLRERIKAGDTTFGEAYRKENGAEWSFYISPKKFYEHTGWCY